MKLQMLTKWLILLVCIAMILITIGIQPNNDSYTSYELIYETDTIEDAYELAAIFDLSLVEYTSYGFSVFESNDVNKKDEYLTYGFEYNHKLEVAANFLFPFDEDPYLNNQYAIEMMDIDLAWNLEEGDIDYLIAIIDTGIDTDHIEFIDRISPLSFNARTDQIGLTYVEDTNGHGTNVAGVIGAIKNNKEGIAGIVQNSQLLVIKANNVDDPSTEDDESKEFSDANIAKSIRYAADQGADIINLSLGGPGYNQVVQNAVNYAHDLGVILVAASGNEGNSEYMYPASYDHVISVGAVDSNMNIADYSNFNPKVDISAPGSGIITTDIDEAYVYASGTSLAAPQVTAVIALFQSYLPGYSDEQTINRIFDAATDRGAIGQDDYYGFGIINAYQAMLVDAITITFETFGGTVLDPIQVPRNEIFYADEPMREGHDFEGWYLDDILTQPFEMGVDIRGVDTKLFANYTPQIYTITFVTEGSQIDPIYVTYGDSFIEPESTLSGHAFAGWYLDPTYNIKYHHDIATNNLTLFAKFIKDPYVVNFYIDGIIDQTYEVNEGATFDLYIPEGENEFLGWYLEPTFITLYNESAVTGNINLYAKFDNEQYSVVYYESDLETIMEIQYVFEGMSAIPPDGPDKASTPSFDYTFTNWSDSAEHVVSNIAVYPVYQESFIEGSVVLRAGIDTIYLDENWHDYGLSIEDNLLRYELKNQPDVETKGRYILYYDIYKGSELITSVLRVVNVIDPIVTITFKPDVTTIYQGETYKDDGAISNVGEVTSSGSVDTNTPGTYEITYEVEFQNKIYTKIKYVYVLEKIDYTTTQSLYLLPSKKEWMI